MHQSYDDLVGYRPYDPKLSGSDNATRDVHWQVDKEIFEAWAEYDRQRNLNPEWWEEYQAINKYMAGI